MMLQAQRMLSSCCAVAGRLFPQRCEEKGITIRVAWIQFGGTTEDLLRLRL